MLVALERKVQAKHRFVEVDVTTETCNLTKEEMMTMENYFKEIKNIIYQLEAISVIILKVFLSLLLLHSLPKE